LSIGFTNCAQSSKRSFRNGGFDMIRVSVPNIITIALIAMLGIGLGKFGLKAIGMNSDWL
jgi:hypothetical protein